MYILENKQTGAQFGAKSFYTKSRVNPVGAAKAAMTRYERQFVPILWQNSVPKKKTTKLLLGKIMLSPKLQLHTTISMMVLSQH